MPIQNWKSVMNRFIIEFGDRMIRTSNWQIHKI